MPCLHFPPCPAVRVKGGARWRTSSGPGEAPSKALNPSASTFEALAACYMNRTCHSRPALFTSFILSLLHAALFHSLTTYRQPPGHFPTTSFTEPSMSVLRHLTTPDGTPVGRIGYGLMNQSVLPPSLCLYGEIVLRIRSRLTTCGNVYLPSQHVGPCADPRRAGLRSHQAGRRRWFELPQQ
jgi:hypothetical protein